MAVDTTKARGDDDEIDWDDELDKARHTAYLARKEARALADSARDLERRAGAAAEKAQAKEAAAKEAAKEAKADDDDDDERRKPWEEDEDEKARKADDDDDDKKPWEEDEDEEKRRLKTFARGLGAFSNMRVREAKTTYSAELGDSLMPHARGW